MTHQEQISEILQRTARIEVDVGHVRNHIENYIKKDIEKHDSRLASVEKKMWYQAGAIGAFLILWEHFKKSIFGG